jgi:hypothetical protein
MIFLRLEGQLGAPSGRFGAPVVQAALVAGKPCGTQVQFPRTIEPYQTQAANFGK